MLSRINQSKNTRREEKRKREVKQKIARFTKPIDIIIVELQNVCFFTHEHHPMIMAIKTASRDMYVGIYERTDTDIFTSKQKMCSIFSKRPQNKPVKKF